MLKRIKLYLARVSKLSDVERIFHTFIDNDVGQNTLNHRLFATLVFATEFVDYVAMMTEFL